MTKSINDKLSKQLGVIFNAILDSADKEEIESYQMLKELSLFQKATKALQSNNPELFYYEFLYPFEKVVSGLLKVEISNHSEKLGFLFLHSQWIERHFNFLIEKVEGSACCADKSRTIIKEIAQSLLLKTDIHFNYSQQYTFHLPTKIFTDHQSIMEFFDALHAFHWGNPRKYLHQMSILIKRIEP